MAGSTIVDEQVAAYLQRVRDLYASAREWLEGAATFEEREIEVMEGPVAAYAAPVLTVRRASRLPVEFVPRGWRIIGVLPSPHHRGEPGQAA